RGRDPDCTPASALVQEMMLFEGQRATITLTPQEVSLAPATAASSSRVTLPSIQKPPAAFAAGLSGGASVTTDSLPSSACSSSRTVLAASAGTAFDPPVNGPKLRYSFAGPPRLPAPPAPAPAG